MKTLIDMIIGKIESSTVDWREDAKGNKNIEIQQKDLDALGELNFNYCFVFSWIILS